MLTLLKKDLQLNGIYLLIVILCIPIIYLFGASMIGISMWAMIVLVISTFYYDSKDSLHKYLRGMPIHPKDVVLARYVFIVTMLAFFLFYSWMIELFIPVPLLFDINSDSNLDGIIVAFTFTIMSVGIAVTFPIYYFIQTFIFATTIQIGVIFVVAFSATWVLSLLDPVIDKIRQVIHLEPTLIMISFSLISLYLSYRLSTKIYLKKDII